MPNLTNHYFALRHGESTANVAGIIVSDPAIGTRQYGLSDKGKTQLQAISEYVDILGANVRIYSSDFLRAKETANIAQKILHSTHPIQFTPLLRERYFGTLNGTTDNQYQQVWDSDFSDPNHEEFNVESVNKVTARAVQLINDIEQEHRNEFILLVSHGDLLQNSANMV